MVVVVVVVVVVVAAAAAAETSVYNLAPKRGHTMALYQCVGGNLRPSQFQTKYFVPTSGDLTTGARQ